VYYIDNSGNNNPWFNLALEEYAVRHLDRNNDYLLLYINEPSIIIGKHQNVIEEVNQIKAGELGIPVIRRISGGGTVYHDLGNLNISVITNQTLKNFNKYLKFLKPVIEVLRDLGLEASLNARNNILINNKKISGNAQFTSRQRLLSHGTLLVNSDLTMIGTLIKPENKQAYHSKSTKSIRSQITNICHQLGKQISAEDIKQKILKKISDSNPAHYKLTKTSQLEIEKLAENKYKSWQWNYGLSPECQIKKTCKSVIGLIKLEMQIAGGIIQSLSIENQNLNVKQQEAICGHFINKSLDYATLKMLEQKMAMDKSLIEINRLPWIEIFLN